jgi:hypothetical protein
MAEIRSSIKIQEGIQIFNTRIMVNRNKKFWATIRTADLLNILLVLVTSVLSSTIQNVIHWQCNHSKSHFTNDYTTSCQPEILNHYQKPGNYMFWALHIIILTRASRYSTLLSNVVSFSFSTASRERQDMSTKQTEITPWVINIWVLNYYLNGF